MNCVEELSSFPLEGPVVFGFTALPDGGFATGHHFDVHVWNDAGALEATLEGHADTVYALAHCPSTGSILSASWDCDVKVWRDNACVHTLSGHTDGVNAVTVSHLDGSIVSGSADHTARVWAPSAGECVATLEGHTDEVTAVCMLDDGDVVTGSDDQTVRVWERGSWACTAVRTQPYQVWTLAPVPEGGFVVGGGRYAAGFVSMWRGGEETFTLATASLAAEVVAVVGGTIVVATEQAVSIFQDGVLIGEWKQVRPSVAALPGGRFAAVQWDNGRRSRRVLRVLRVVRPSRLVTVHIMITAWSAHGGVPPPAPESPSRQAALARTLSLRRFCRVRDGTEALEVVEPFGRDVVGFV